MLYLYHKDAGAAQLSLEGDAHRYIFKVRRHKQGESLHLRNLQDGIRYSYTIQEMGKRSLLLVLEDEAHLEVTAKHPLHIGWCVIEPKSIEKVLPSLNEMGVEKITFIYCQRSQKSFKPDFQRLEKIVLNSSQQSGRSVMMQFAMADSLEDFLKQSPDAVLLDFSETNFISHKHIRTIVVGCEGGFTQEERALFSDEKVAGFDTPLVLKSESAVCAVAAKILL